MKELIVIKVGTSTLMDDQNRPSRTFETVAQDIVELREKYEVILVTSGAIGCGMQLLDIQERPTNIDHLQALSSIGQVELMTRWRLAFKHTTLGQILLTERELSQMLDVSTFIATVKAMHQLGAVPVINENDAITNEEITFGDNDSLAARAAVVLGASKLILLTDQNGVQRHFGTNKQARIPVLSLGDAEQHVASTHSTYGTGGLTSKLVAVRLAHEASIETYIADARQAGASLGAIAGKAGTKIVQ